MAETGRAPGWQRAAALVAGVCVLPAVLAQTPTQEAASLDPIRGGLGLKLEPELAAPTAAGMDEDLPTFVEADRLDGVVDRNLEATGNVVVRRRGQTLSADRLSYSIPDNAVSVSGNVRSRRLGDTISGDSAYYDLDTNSGYVDKPEYSFRFGKYRARGTASRIDIRDRDRYRAERATYTNCNVGADDWYLKVSRLDLDRLRDVGVARNATVYFQGVPILYTPWIDFPLGTRRKTGFLAPLIGTTNNSGFEVTLPFYWNIAPNRDYTLTTRLLAERGVQWNNEFRYLQPTFQGQLRADVLPNDRVADATRWAYSIQHSQLLTQRLRGYVNAQGVSDDNYFTDLSDNVAATSQTNLPREFGLTYNGDWWSLLARSQQFQTLQSADNPVTPPYARVPQVALRAARENVGGLNLEFFGEVVNFDQSQQQRGWRQVYYPWATYPLRGPFWYLTPKLGLNYTVYSYPGEGRPTDTRSLPVISLDTGMTFDRTTGFFGRGFRQTLEPRVYYVYIPYKNQDSLPVYDTSQADFNLTQVFTENQYTGWDRINNANQITTAVTSRLIDSGSGAEWIRGTLAQRFYFETLQVTLPGQADSTNNSDLLAGLAGSVTRNWTANLNLQYAIEDGDFEKFNVGLRYRPAPRKILNLGYRFTSNTLEQVDIAALWPLSRRWFGTMRWNYSLDGSELLRGLVGLEYNESCWAARFVAQSFVTGVSERSSAFFLQLELTGLSRLGISPLRVLRENIVGYEEASDASAAPEIYYPGLEYE
jgi:LPS-assembly protein